MRTMASTVQDGPAFPGEEKEPNVQVCDIVWAKVHKKGTCWPGLVIDGAKRGQEISSLKKVWVYWFGDHRFTEVHKDHIYDFKTEFRRLFKKKIGKGYNAGVIEALKECAQRMGEIKNDLSCDVLLNWAYGGFSKCSEIFQNLEKQKALLTSNGYNVRQEVQEFCQLTKDGKDGSDTKSTSSLDSTVEHADSRKLGIVKAIRSRKVILTNLCLSCFTITDDLEDHPLFNAYICSCCLNVFKNYLYSVGTDGQNNNCVICLGVDPALVMCSRPFCFRSFCENCLRDIFQISTKDIKHLEDWNCFMCTAYSEKTHGFVQPLYDNWRLNLWELFHKNHFESTALLTGPVRILFTGGNACSVRLAVDRLSKVKIEVSKIFVSGFFEKDVAVLSSMFAEKLKTVPPPWDLNEVTVLKYFPIDIVVGGSRKLYSADQSDKNSMNAFCVFDDFCRIVSIVQEDDLISPVFWMFEFEEPMCSEFYEIISRCSAFEPGRWQTSPEIIVSILVWTNVSALWTLLSADGMPKKTKE